MYSEFLFRDAGADAISGNAGVDARVAGRGDFTRYPGDFGSGVAEVLLKRRLPRTKRGMVTAMAAGH